MLERRVLHGLLAKMIRHGGLFVRYWDGKTESYGENPGITLHLRKPAAARAILLSGTLGLGEGYMNGLIEIEGPLDRLVKVVTDNPQCERWIALGGWINRTQRNTRASQSRQIQHHYDIGNDFYRLWLDESMTYSCAYFRHPTDTLEEAQQQKLHHILRKLRLSEGMRLLDIGSGWGQLLIAAAQEYGVSGLGITLSKEQFELSNQRARALGLEHRVRFEQVNYQDLSHTGEHFDRIVSVGMFEHVGRANHGHYFDAVQAMLKPDGLSMLHSITCAAEGPSDRWMDRYIFPGGYVPSYREAIAYLPKYNFQFLDYENLRMHYAKTLDEWLRRFEAHVETVRGMYDEKFVRMWRFYLGTCAGAFRWNRLSLSQILFGGPEYAPAMTRDYMYPAMEFAPRLPQRAASMNFVYAHHGNGNGRGDSAALMADPDAAFARSPGEAGRVG